MCIDMALKYEPNGKNPLTCGGSSVLNQTDGVM